MLFLSSLALLFSSITGSNISNEAFVITVIALFKLVFYLGLIATSSIVITRALVAEEAAFGKVPGFTRGSLDHNTRLSHQLLLLLRSRRPYRI